MNSDGSIAPMLGIIGCGIVGWIVAVHSCVGGGGGGTEAVLEAVLDGVSGDIGEGVAVQGTLVSVGVGSGYADASSTLSSAGGVLAAGGHTSGASPTGTKVPLAVAEVATPMQWVTMPLTGAAK